MEPKEQEGPNSDAVEVKNKKRKRGESEASENVKENKRQLKKKKRRQKRKKAKKAANGKSKEEGLDHSESGSTGMQLVVKADGIIKKKKRRRKRKKCRKLSNGKSMEEGLDRNESGSGLQLVEKAVKSIIRRNVVPCLNIYVGGIPYYSTEDDIRSYFEGFGTITYIDCMTFPDSGMCRGIAIITYKTEAAAKRALALDGSDLGGVFLKIQPYKSVTVEKLPKFPSSVVDGFNRIYIDNLSWDTNEDDIWKLFADCAVASIRLQFGEDKETGESKGYAHVDFADGLSLHTALKLDQSILYGRPVRISCAVPMKATGTQLVPLLNDNQEDGGKKGQTTKLEATIKDNAIHKINVIENQVTSSRTNIVSSMIRRKRYSFSSKIRKRKCYKCREYSHLWSACPKKFAANLTIQGQMISSEKGPGAMLIPLPKDNQEDRRKKGNTPKLEATRRDDKVDRSNVSLVVENQVTSSGKNALSSKIRWRTYFVSSKIRLRICYRCREYGHLSSSCPKKLAANSTIPGQMIVSSEKGTGAALIPLLKDSQEDRGKGNTTKLEATPRDDNVDRSNVSVFIENQVTSCGTNALSSKIQWRTYFVGSKIRLRICYRCREYGHLSSFCPKKLAARSTIPEQMIVSSEKGSGATLISLPKKGNQEDSGKKESTTKLEATPRDEKVDQSNVSVFVENQDTSSGTNARKSKIWWRTYFVSSKIRWRICYRCREYGHLSSSCPKKLASDSTNPGDHLCGTTLISLPKDNQEDSGKKENTTKLEATPRDDKVDQSNVSVVVENQVTSSGKNSLPSKIWKRKCFECKQRGHLLSSCPKKLAADLANPVDNQDDDGNKRNFTEFEATPRDYEVDRSNVSGAVENHVTSSGTNAPSSKRLKRTCYECREHGHLSSSCPKRLAADSTNPVLVTTDKLLPIHRRGCTSTVDSMPVGKTSFQIPVGCTLVRWLLPPDPWIKLNTDGSFDSNTGLASGGGLIRDHFGDLQLAFFTPLEATSSSDAELQALLHGLHLARHFNRPIWIELDALEIVILLKTGRPGALQIQHTLSHIRALMAQIQTWITHIFREGNRPADYMATMGVGSHALNLVYPHLAPKCFLELVRMDQIGYPSFRIR